jgi:hypothetical protein
VFICVTVSQAPLPCCKSHIAALLSPIILNKSIQLDYIELSIPSTTVIQHRYTIATQTSSINPFILPFCFPSFIVASFLSSISTSTLPCRPHPNCIPWLHIVAIRLVCIHMLIHVAVLQKVVKHWTVHQVWHIAVLLVKVQQLLTLARNIVYRKTKELEHIIG